MRPNHQEPAANPLTALQQCLPDGALLEVRIGLHWTAAVAETQGGIRCGLCSTLASPHHHRGPPEVPAAGDLTRMTGRELAQFASDEQSPTLASVGVAAINALLMPPSEDLWVEGNAEKILAEQGIGKRVVVVGHFPFIPRLREAVGNLDVLELHPSADDLPASKAPEVIPQAQVVAISSMTLANHTLPGLLQLCSPDASVMLLGPSTPLSPALFDFGIDLLSGSIVDDIDAVLEAVSQGANFRQIHRAGVRLITITPPAPEQALARHED